jgi:UMF1 family MFS transporter
VNKHRKAVLGWAMYDWANSAFATTVMAGFFPVFFKQYFSYGIDINMSTAILGFGNSIASLLVAIIAPVLGAIADRGSARKRFLIYFAYFGVLMTASLFMVQKGHWVWAIFSYAMGIIGFSGANIFYDSLLCEVADDNSFDRVSSLGFAMGYLGGGLLFLLNVLMVLMPEKFGLSDVAAIRFSFITVALWWGSFTVFTIVWVPEKKREKAQQSSRSMIKEGFSRFVCTLREIRQLKTVFWFLLAYWFYIDGVNTIIRMAVDYGISLGFASNDLIISLLIVQFVGFPFALAFGKLGQRWGARRSIYLAIFIYMFITLWGAMMDSKEEFYMLAVFIGMVQGGIQALSRSFYAGLIPKDRSAEFFGFYNMAGKFAAILGPAMIGIVGLVARHVLMPVFPTQGQIESVGRIASRCSIVSVLALFIIGGVLFYMVDENKGNIETANL